MNMRSTRDVKLPPKDKWCDRELVGLQHLRKKRSSSDTEFSAHDEVVGVIVGVNKCRDVEV